MAKAINRTTLTRFIREVDTRLDGPVTVFLIGETTQVFEGWRSWTTQIEICTDGNATDKKDFAGIVTDVARAFGVDAFGEAPGDVIPLPNGSDARARPAKLEGLAHVTLRHFDPYSVAFRFIARGDEPDYHLVLTYAENGWITRDEMDAQLHALLPRFSSRTIQQDPAEFRRKYKGLLQMWRAVAPRTNHRVTAV